MTNELEVIRGKGGEHPDWQKKRLAFEAWSGARGEILRERAAIGRDHPEEHGQNVRW